MQEIIQINLTACNFAMKDHVPNLNVKYSLFYSQCPILHYGPTCTRFASKYIYSYF